MEEAGLHSLPNVEVNRCYLIESDDDRPLFVEPMIEEHFYKWNSNHGTVFKQRIGEAGSAFDSEPPLPGHKAADGSTAAMSPTVDDVPQAFTHWTFTASQQTRMVCDIQGFYALGRFVLVDPAIHSAGPDRPPGGYGRTDRGQKGMADFLGTHECNSLCAALRLPPPSAGLGLLAKSCHRTSRVGNGDFDQRFCVICEDVPRQVRFPCGHACACEACAELIRVRDNLCPACRAPLGGAPFARVTDAIAETYVRG